MCDFSSSHVVRRYPPREGGMHPQVELSRLGSGRASVPCNFYTTRLKPYRRLNFGLNDEDARILSSQLRSRDRLSLAFVDLIEVEGVTA